MLTLSVIKMSLLARVSGRFTDQRSLFQILVNYFISAFPAISLPDIDSVEWADSNVWTQTSNQL